MRRTALILLGTTILAAAGCQVQQQQQPKVTYSNQWPGWVGNTNIDTTGDVQKLQGKWSWVPQGEGSGELNLVFEGDTLTYEYPGLGDEGYTRKTGQKPYVNKYRFVLNSSLDPKVIRFIDRLGEGKPIPGHQAPLSQWYRLEGDTLTFWDHFTEQGERPSVSYRRTTGGGV
jgi:hypothetical protein